MGSSRELARVSVGRLQSAVARLRRELIDAAEVADDDDQRAGSLATVDRLDNSVLRPLGALLESDGEAPMAAESDGSAATLWQLAVAATRLRSAGGAPLELLEATAALQDLACSSADADAPAQPEDRLAALRELQGGCPSGIELAPNGPYLVTNIELRDWLDRPVPPRPQLALCRCGASAIKPFCDGSHARIGFSDAKSQNRVPDRRDIYVGQQVTIYDNRGICQHSGLCTDRLATVFRQGTEPFVAPSGGRMDEIIRAVRDCPSGALAYGHDGLEARDDVDWHGTRAPSIEVTKDGPYRVTGNVALRDEHGRDVARAQGASFEHYALCRCGQSQNKPFCSGMHWYVDFHDPTPDPDATPTVFEWCGGLPTLTRMTRIFYEKYVTQDQLLAPLFANMSADHPQRVAKWLGEVFGGPKRYSAEYGGYQRMISQHMGRGLTEEARARWVALLLKSAHEAGMPDDAEFRSVFLSYIEWGSHIAVENSQPGAQPPGHMPMPHWEWNTASGPPGSRVSALAPTAEEAEPDVTLPAPDQPVSFAQHIKPLFRERDRRSMQFAFDLWSHDDVRANAQAILARLRAGTMPCDGAWPDEWISVLDRWTGSGMAP